MWKFIRDLFKYKKKVKEQELAIRILEQKILMLQQECESLKEYIRKMQTQAFSYEDDYVAEAGDDDGRKQ